jgi:predicted AAA+ superfamily ATPase
MSRMSNIKRILAIDLPARKSAFLWGPRKTGKSTYLREKFPQSIVYDFLQTDLFLEFSKRPSLLRERLLAKESYKLKQPVILDEVQKIPQILDEVHWLMENKGLRFILCGSSARKLKRGKANLLGGRAWRFEMFPLVSAELVDLDLLKVLNHGMILVHYLEDSSEKSLKAYTQDYLKEEVIAEGLTRNIPAFSRFFDAMAYSHGQLTNYSNIARDCGVDSKTVREYYQILVDTLMGRFVEPFKRRQDRQIITKAAKFYLFDVGVAGSIMKRKIVEARGELFGKAFEHFVLMELVAHSSYNELDYEINFWRTKSGLEIDFVLAKGEVAIEVKGSSRVEQRDLRPMMAFVEEYAPEKALLVCNEREERVQGRIRIMPWRRFLEDLWAGKIIR